MSLQAAPSILRERLEELVNCAKQKLGVDVKIPTLRMTQRGKIAGSARLQTHEIRLNPTLWEDNQQEYLEEVLPHELSHLIVFQLYGKVKPHGKEWQSVMRGVFGVSPSTRHAMNTDKVAGQQFEYRCGCTTHQLSIRRHNKVIRNKQTYACRRCGQSLLYCQPAN